MCGSSYILKKIRVGREHTGRMTLRQFAMMQRSLRYNANCYTHEVLAMSAAVGVHRDVAT